MPFPCSFKMPCATHNLNTVLWFQSTPQSLRSLSQKQVSTEVIGCLRAAGLKVYKSYWSSGCDSQLPIRQSAATAGLHAGRPRILSGFKQRLLLFLIHVVVFWGFFTILRPHTGYSRQRLRAVWEMDLRCLRDEGTAGFITVCRMLLLLLLRFCSCAGVLAPSSGRSYILRRLSKCRGRGFRALLNAD